MTVRISIQVLRIAFAAVIAAAPAAVAAGDRHQPISTNFCWRSLAPETGPEDLATFSTGPALAADRDGKVWLMPDSRILTWVAGRWTVVPAPSREGVDEISAFMVAPAPSGRAFLGAAANRDDGSTVLHIARAGAESWEWLGAPLISAQDPFRHIQSVSIAFVGEQPVVAWSEEFHARQAGLFVARWNGTTWQRLGALVPDIEDSFLPPAVAVDSKQQIWLAWTGAGAGVRVARWTGSTWLDVGRDSLDKLSTASGPTAVRELSLAVDANGRVWLLRIASQNPRGTALSLVRWDGTNWTTIRPPSGAPGKESTAWSAAMLLRNDTPIIAWSQSGATDNHHLYVSEWIDDRWIARLSDFHLAEGVSNVHGVQLADGGTRLLVAWDEPGKDQRRTRVIEAYACKPGETPATPPRSIVERDTWPTTVDQAAKQIVSEMDEASKARVRATAGNQLIQYHHGWGTGIRNSLGLWRGNEALLASCGGGKRVHPDDCSMVIIGAVWALLQAKP
jgi:hypothetical protein